MTNPLKKLAFTCLLLLALGQQAVASESNVSKGVKKKKYQNRQLLVRYKDKVSPNEKDFTHFSVGAYVLDSFEFPNNLEVVEVVKGISLDAAQEFYADDPNVLYVEPNYELYAYMAPPPNEPVEPPGEDDEPIQDPPLGDDPPADDPLPPELDPKYSEQWGLHNEGQTGGLNDVDINAPEMWEHITGDEDIVIAVIDTGVNYLHPDLINNMWVNPGEIPDNGIDDDGNGVIDDIHGFNAIDKSGNPMDDHGHGSHCAGVIAAEGQNIHGGRGVMQKAKIIGCKFLSASGGGTTADAIACLEYLRDLKTRSDNPVNVFASSNSWGGGPASQALEDAIAEHQREGILFVAAASNDSKDNDIVDTYPADYKLSNIISVAAIDHEDQIAWFSNYGRRTVHVGAPGVDILSTVLRDEYDTMSGTSMATPFVTGLAGMIKAANPTYDYVAVKNLLMTGGVPTEALNSKTVSGRRIRAYDENGIGSLTCHDQVVSGRLSPSEDHLLVEVGEKIMLSAININCEAPNGEVIVPLLPDGQEFELTDTGLGIDSAADDGMYTFEWLAEVPGTYEFVFPKDDIVSVRVYDAELWEGYKYEKLEEMNYRTIQGTPLNAKDDFTTTTEIPFAVEFAGDQIGFNKVTIGSNGALSLTNEDAISFTNLQLPADKYVSFIAPFWDDLNPSDATSDVFVETIGDAPNREFVIEWRNVRHYSSQDTGTFQVVLFENSSDILFNYLDVEFGSASVDLGASATIGVQATSGRVTQLGFNEAVLQSNTAYLFTLGEQEPDPDPEPIDPEPVEPDPLEPAPPSSDLPTKRS